MSPQKRGSRSARANADNPQLDASPVLMALEQLGGGALVVLARDLHIVDATPAADRLLGSPPRGEDRHVGKEGQPSCRSRGSPLD